MLDIQLEIIYDLLSYLLISTIVNIKATLMHKNYNLYKIVYFLTNIIYVIFENQLYSVLSHLIL